MKLAIALLLFLLPSSLLAAEVPEDFANCAKISEAKLRLACFDGLTITVTKPSPSEGTTYREMSLTDFKLDKAQLVGQRIKTRGEFSLFGEEGMLEVAPMDSSSVTLKIADLPREDRKRLLDCDSANRHCMITVSGVVVKSIFEIAIKVEAVSFN